MKNTQRLLPYILCLFFLIISITRGYARKPEINYTFSKIKEDKVGSYRNPKPDGILDAKIVLNIKTFTTKKIPINYIRIYPVDKNNKIIKNYLWDTRPWIGWFIGIEQGKIFILNRKRLNPKNTYIRMNIRNNADLVLYLNNKNNIFKKGQRFCVEIKYNNKIVKKHSDYKITKHSQSTIYGSIKKIKNSFCGKLYFIKKNTKKIPSFDNLKVEKKLYTKTINITPRKLDNYFLTLFKRKKWFAIEYNAEIKIKKQGVFIFSLSSISGAKLYINDKEIIDNDGNHYFQNKLNRILLKKGKHKIKITYFKAHRYLVYLKLIIKSPRKKNFEVFNTDSIY